jgi:hypothetical protein
MDYLKELEFYAKLGIGISIFFANDEYKWWSNITNSHTEEDEILYGYDTFNEALLEAFQFAKLEFLTL